MPSLQILFHHLDLPLTASQTHSYPLTWTFLRVPVWLRSDFITHAYWIGLTPLTPNFFENPDLSKLPFPFRRSLWSFYRVQDHFSLCIPVSDKKIYIWCNVSCNVWLCMNVMFESFRFVFHPNLFYSFFIFSRLNKYKCHAPNHADERLWNINLNVNFFYECKQNVMWA